MTNLIQTGYRNIKYAIKEFLWKPKTYEHEATIDRLRRYGVSLCSLNCALDRENIPLSMGRFPELLDIETGLATQVNYHLETIINNTFNRRLSMESRIRIISEYVSQKIADDMAINPRTFERIFQEKKD